MSENCDLEFEVYSNRWSHTDTYRVRRTKTGWYVGLAAISGDCDKAGRPFLYDNFRQDSICFPSDLPDHLEWLWDKVEEGGLNDEEIQKSLKQLADWVSDCERKSPGGVFIGLKRLTEPE